MIVDASGAAPGGLPGRYDRAQGTVEFAFCAVAVFLLLFGIMEMALAILAYNSISFAASEAARYGAAVQSSNQNTSSTNTAIQNVAIGAAPDIPLTASNIVVTWPSDSLMSGRVDINVAIAYNYPLSIPFMKNPVTLSLTATSTMMASQ